MFVCVCWKIKLAASLKMGRGKEGETWGNSGCQWVWLGAQRLMRRDLFPCSLLPKSMKMFLSSEWSTKLQALMPAKPLLLQLHVIRSTEIQRNYQMHKDLQICKITNLQFYRFAKSQLVWASAATPCWWAQPSSWKLFLLPSQFGAGDRQVLTVIFEQMPEAKVTSTWLTHKWKTFALD